MVVLHEKSVSREFNSNNKKIQEENKNVGGGQGGGREKEKRKRGKKRYGIYYILIKGKTLWNFVEAVTTAW